MADLTSPDELEIHLERIANNIPGMLQVVRVSPDRTLKTIYCSQGSIGLYETAPELVTSGNHVLRNMIVDDDMPSFLDFVGRVLRTRSQENWDGRFKLPSGCEKWIRVLSQAYGSAGDHLIVDSVHFDITPLKQRELMLVNSARLSSLGEMAGGIAHEINNPLAIIQGRISHLRRHLAAEPLDPKKLFTDLDKIDQTVSRIAKIVRSLLTISRNSAADPMEIVELGWILEETLNLCQERFHNSGIELRSNPFASIQVECRPPEISQILLNLINNAFDAIEGSPEKWMSLDVAMGEHCFKVSITDSGRGISAPILKQMMTPFFTSKEAGKGTGLGLSIAKKLAEAHQGKLFYDSTSSHTRFVLELPYWQKAPMLDSNSNE